MQNCERSLRDKERDKFYFGYRYRLPKNRNWVFSNPNVEIEINLFINISFY